MLSLEKNGYYTGGKVAVFFYLILKLHGGWEGGIGYIFSVFVNHLTYQTTHLWAPVTLEPLTVDFYDFLRLDTAWVRPSLGGWEMKWLLPSGSTAYLHSFFPSFPPSGLKLGNILTTIWKLVSYYLWGLEERKVGPGCGAWWPHQKKGLDKGPSLSWVLPSDHQTTHL